MIPTAIERKISHTKRISIHTQAHTKQRTFHAGSELYKMITIFQTWVCLKVM